MTNLYPPVTTRRSGRVHGGNYQVPVSVGTGTEETGSPNRGDIVKMRGLKDSVIEGSVVRKRT